LSPAAGGRKVMLLPMIKSYSDHAANERTYLAWLRTGIAIIAFGFVLERFDIFLHTIARTLDRAPAPNLSHGGREAGVALVVAGLLALGVATWRFVSTSRRIAREDIVPYDARGALALGGFVIVLGLFIFAYITRLLFAAG
jgi:putative membrane protein